MKYIIISFYFKQLVDSILQGFKYFIWIAPSLFSRTGEPRENYGRMVGEKDIIRFWGSFRAQQCQDSFQFFS